MGGPTGPHGPPLGPHGPPGRWALGPMGSGAHGLRGPRAPGAHGAPGVGFWVAKPFRGGFFEGFGISIKIGFLGVLRKILTSQDLAGNPHLKLKFQNSPIRLVLKGSWRFLRAPVEVRCPGWPESWAVSPPWLGGPYPSYPTEILFEVAKIQKL